MWAGAYAGRRSGSDPQHCSYIWPKVKEERKVVLSRSWSPVSPSVPYTSRLCVPTASENRCGLCDCPVFPFSACPLVFKVVNSLSHRENPLYLKDCPWGWRLCDLEESSPPQQPSPPTSNFHSPQSWYVSQLQNLVWLHRASKTYGAVLAPHPTEVKGEQ